MTDQKGGHKCFDHYRRVDRWVLICDMCGKLTTVDDKKNPVKDMLDHIDDGIDLNEGD